MHEIKLSVIVTVYNVRNYLDDCLQSLSEQSIQTVEFIIIDDGSTDGSSDICDRWSAVDKRFKVIHQENLGTFRAREIGIIESRGEKIIFVDGDDLLAREALYEMLKLIQKSKADIIQFSSCPFNCTSKIQFININRRLYSGNKHIIKNINIAKSFFLDKSNAWILWNKIYDSRILKQSCKNICNYKCSNAEDMYKLFLVSFYSNTFQSYKTEPLYLYRVNSGISTKKQDIYTFISQIKFTNIISDLNNFLQCEHASSEWYVCLREIKEYLYSILLNTMSKLSKKEFQIAFRLFYNKYDLIMFLSQIEIIFKDRQNELAMAYKNSQNLQRKTAIHSQKISFISEKKTIGIFYHRYYNGGIERVISLQIPLFIKLGYRIVLFTEEINSNLEYSLPSEVIRIKLPISYTQKRADIFLFAIRKYNISVLCHHAASSRILLFDLIFLREIGVNTVIIAHSSTTHFMGVNKKYFFDYISVYKIADTLLTLSSCEENFYRQCGVNAYYIPNPIINIDQKTNTPISQQNAKILWVGRLSKEKNYKEAIKIFKKVLKTNNNVLCYIVGSGSVIDNLYVKYFIIFNGLTGKIIHVPYTKDVQQFYKKASIQLLTSSFEAFPMVVAEGKLYGIPLVTYELPKVELLKDGKGYICVERHNIQEAAESVLKILKDKEYAELLSREAYESIVPFIHYNQAQEWSNILQSPCRQYYKKTEENTKNMSLFWMDMISMYHEGLSRRPTARQQLKQIIKSMLKIKKYFLSPRSRLRSTIYKIYYFTKDYFKP